MNARSLGLAAAAVMLVACGCARDRAARPDPPVTAAAAMSGPVELPELRWLSDGKRILVGQRWLLRPGQGAAEPFSCAPSGHPHQPDCRSLNIAFSRDGTQVLVLDSVWLAIGPVEGPLGAAVPIPRWVPSDPERPAAELANVGFWVSDHQIFIQQLATQPPLAHQCGAFDTRTRRWRRLRTKCPEGGFSNIWRIDSGPGRWLAIYSGGEGQSSVDLVEYDLDRGASDVAGLSITPAPSGMAHVRFHPDGARVDVISPCHLEQERAPCPDDEGARWRLYTGPSAKGPLRLVRADLPPGSAIDPSGTRFAWPLGTAVCVGDPGQGKPVCVPVPFNR